MARILILESIALDPLLAIPIPGCRDRDGWPVSAMPPIRGASEWAAGEAFIARQFGDTMPEPFRRKADQFMEGVITLYELVTGFVDIAISRRVSDQVGGLTPPSEFRTF